MTIDCQSAAAIGLKLNAVIHSKFANVHVWNPVTVSGVTGTGILMTTDTTLDNIDTAWNDFIDCSVVEAPIGLQLDGNSHGNCAHNNFIGLTILYRGTTSADAGIYLVRCDNNCFTRTFISNHDGSTGFGVIVNSPVDANSNYFYHLQAGRGFRINGTSGSPSIVGKNFVFGYDQSNNEPDPSTDSTNPAKNYLAWISNTNGGTADMYGITVH